jgi:hypothetical protein
MAFLTEWGGLSISTDEAPLIERSQDMGLIATTCGGFLGDSLPRRAYPRRTEYGRNLRQYRAVALWLSVAMTAQSLYESEGQRFESSRAYFKSNKLGRNQGGLLQFWESGCHSRGGIVLRQLDPNRKDEERYGNNAAFHLPEVWSGFSSSVACERFS